MEALGLDAPGDEARADFGAFFADHYRELGTLAYRLSGRRQVAEEITADAFAEAWRRWDEISGSDSPSAVMHEILERYAEGRAHADPPGETQDPYEPEAARVRALLVERIALTPQQRTAALALGSGGADDGGRRAAGGLGRFRRPGPIGIVIAVNALAAIVAIVVTLSTGGSSAGHGKIAAVSLAETSTVEGADGDSPNSAEAATGFTPSHSVSASASPSPTADQSTNSASSSAAATTAAAAAASPSASASASNTSTATNASSANLVTATGTVSSGSNSSWTELDVGTDVSQTLSAMTITIKVAHCTGLSETGEWNSGASGQFTETQTTNSDGSITYVFELVSGDEVGPGDVTFAAQFSHDASGWSASADTYSVTARGASSGATGELGGSF
jgi:hypothetical protein